MDRIWRTGNGNRLDRLNSERNDIPASSKTRHCLPENLVLSDARINKLHFFEQYTTLQHNIGDLPDLDGFASCQIFGQFPSLSGFNAATPFKHYLQSHITSRWFNILHSPYLPTWTVTQNFQKLIFQPFQINTRHKDLSVTLHLSATTSNRAAVWQFFLK